MPSQPDRELFFVTILARPDHEISTSEKFGGAYVNCWVDEPSADAAVARAQLEVRDSGWIPESIDNVVAVTRKTYERREEDREYFEQALVDGIVLVFHTFPHEPDEKEPVH
jgi:hypothetical protein